MWGHPCPLDTFLVYFSDVCRRYGNADQKVRSSSENDRLFLHSTLFEDTLDPNATSNLTKIVCGIIPRIVHKLSEISKKNTKMFFHYLA